MATERIENGNFVYVNYSRQGNKDIDRFIAILSAIRKEQGSKKDVVIDFGTSKAITWLEIGPIVRLSLSLEASSRFLHIIACEELSFQLSSISITNLDHLTIHKSSQAFTDQLNKN